MDQLEENRNGFTAVQEKRSTRQLKEKVSITLDGDLIEKLKFLADEDDRSFSQYINMVLKDHVRSSRR